MPLIGARLLVAATLFFQTVIPSPILNDDQRVLSTNSFATPQNAQQPSRKLNGKFLHITGTCFPACVAGNLWLVPFNGIGLAREVVVCSTCSSPFGETYGHC
jgi:hypothetical protein